MRVTILDLEKLCPASWRETAPSTWVADFGTLTAMLSYSSETQLYILQMWSWHDVHDVQKIFLQNLNKFDRRVIDLLTKFPQHLGADCPDWIKPSLIDHLDYKIRFSSYAEGRPFVGAIRRLEEKV